MRFMDGGSVDGWTVALGLGSLMWVGLAYMQVRFWLSMPRLTQAPPTLPAGMPWPRLSVLVPSCDEE